MGYYSNSSECYIQRNKWKNRTFHRMCLCVGGTCGVIRTGMCKRNAIRSVINLIVWSAKKECDVVDYGHSMEHSQTQ